MNKRMALPAASGAVNVREIVSPGGVKAWLVEDYAVRLYRAQFGTDAALPDYFVTAQTLTPTTPFIPLSE